MVKALVFVLVVFSLSANSADFPVAQNAQFHGFDLNGKIINPKCINLLQPWISDRGIIIRSIVLDYCQTSNQAFEGMNYSLNEGVVSYYEEAEDPYSQFSYSVIGKLLDNRFVLRHEGYIGIYHLERRLINDEFTRKAPEKLSTVLTKITSAWLPCISDTKIMGNKIIVVDSSNDSATSSSAMCDGEPKEYTYDFGESW